MESWGTEVPHLGVASPTDPPGLGHPQVELPDCFARRLILCNVTLFFLLPPAGIVRYLASRAEQRLGMSLAFKDPCGLVMQYVDYIVACVGSVSHSIEAWKVPSTS